jgi:mRNA interferase MazF
MEKILRGQIHYADLSPVMGSEQGGRRPVVIIQNDMGNNYSPTTIVAIVTSRYTKAKLPTHCWLETQCLPIDSMVELEQIRTIDKKRLCGYMGSVTLNDQKRIDKALRISLGLGE